LRWFTPAIEIPLCGHATLASAHALWQTGRLASHPRKRDFHTMSGELICRRAGKLIEMDFPALVAVNPRELPAAAIEALTHSIRRTSFAIAAKTVRTATS
jgi:predicted PhzF superfamily epimerase YddE/YHI9